jgi:AcrR family transcriptional regulator
VSPPGPGRPRSLEADQAILDAALVVFAEEGYDGLTIEAVAARAGVGKGTVYRRYPGKAELVFHAASCLTASDVPDADTGSLAGDLHVLARWLVHLLDGTIAGRCVPQLVAAVSRTPELAGEHARFVAERRHHALAAVARAIGRGEVPPDTDASLVVDLLAGPIFYRHLVCRGALDVDYADRVVDAVLASLAPRVASEPTPAFTA